MELRAATPSKTVIVPRIVGSRTWEAVVHDDEQGRAYCYGAGQGLVTVCNREALIAAVDGFEGAQYGMWHLNIDRQRIYVGRENREKYCIDWVYIGREY